MNNGEVSSKLIAPRNKKNVFLQPLDLGVPLRSMQSTFKSFWEEIWI